MSKAIFVANARKQFTEFASVWFDFLLEHFPTCENTKDLKIFFNGVVVPSTSKTDEQIELWYESLTTPLNQKRTKYAKAVERITQQPCTIYHAISYRDVATLKHTMTSEMLTRVDIFTKYDSAQIDEETKATGWKLLDKMNAACLEFKEQNAPQVPTRAEIQENIRMRNAKPDEVPSMAKAFHTHYNALCTMLNAANAIENASEAEIKQHMSKWNAFSRDTTDGEKNSTLCQNSDPRALKPLERCFPDLVVPADQHANETLWKNITQLNGFAAVTENIPSDMMGRIETMANKLADDIVSGKTDMGSVNLQEIGEQVLAGGNEADMSKFASSIDQLMPALQQFHKM